MCIMPVSVFIVFICASVTSLARHMLSAFSCVSSGSLKSLLFVRLFVMPPMMQSLMRLLVRVPNSHECFRFQVSDVLVYGLTRLAIDFFC